MARRKVLRRFFLPFPFLSVDCLYFSKANTLEHASKDRPCAYRLKLGMIPNRHKFGFSISNCAEYSKHRGRVRHARFIHDNNALVREDDLFVFDGILKGSNGAAINTRVFRQTICGNTR